jgi:hypothetical protein
MPLRYYTFFGVNNNIVDVLLNITNPLSVDVRNAQIRPYDEGVDSMFKTYASVDPNCDGTWFLKANSELYHPLKVTTNTVAIIRSKQLKTILDGLTYYGNMIYLVSLNEQPIVNSDLEYPDINYSMDDISGDGMAPYINGFIHANIEPFTPSLMSKIFIQQSKNVTYSASDVRNWVSQGNIFVNSYGCPKNYNGGGEATSTLTLSVGDLIRVKKDDVCLRPLDGSIPTEYTVTRSGTRYYWSTLPSLAGWTTNVILAYVKGATEYPYVIEMIHNASGGILLSVCGGATVSGYVSWPAWYYPIILFQYPLGKAGYLGVSPSYVQE